MLDASVADRGDSPAAAALLGEDEYAIPELRSGVEATRAESLLISLAARSTSCSVRSPGEAALVSLVSRLLRSPRRKVIWVQQMRQQLPSVAKIC